MRPVLALLGLALLPSLAAAAPTPPASPEAEMLRRILTETLRGAAALAALPGLIDTQGL